MAQAPDPANADVEEKKGEKKCKLHYHYDAQKGDQVSWDLEDTAEGDFCILFTVKRLNSESVVYLKRSKAIPANLKDQLVKKGENLNLKGQFYTVQLEKKTDFLLKVYFLPDSPPLMS